ncbi:hypothetical protein, partial [Thiolapillus sp.]|uniref:hypothetical protein n=1 Tax=Thiolapillus sp. TaxID=2017437 RepID=UPI003AF90F04
HDCWASYLSYDQCGHGLCGSHLLRELTFVIDSNNYAWAANKRVFGLVKDFGTSQSPKSTRPLTTYWCPSRPGHQALRNNFASSLLLRTWLPYDWTPRSEAYFVFPLAQGTPGKQCGLAATGVYQPSLRSPWLAAFVLISLLRRPRLACLSLNFQMKACKACGNAMILAMSTIF